MEVKPGYKQTVVGVIPEDWHVVSVLDACSKVQDGTHFSPRIGGNDYLYITSKNIRFGYFDTSSAARIDRAQHQAIYKRCDVKKGDLLLTKDGANTGNAALNTLDEEFSLLSSVAFLRFHTGKHCARYFLQQILTSQGQRQIQDAMAGNAITRLTLEKVKKLRFAIPPTITEQQAIAEALSDADALIESLEQLVAKKRQIKQGAMQELLTGKKRLPGFSGKWDTYVFSDLFTVLRNASNSRHELSEREEIGYVHYGDIHTHPTAFLNPLTKQTYISRKKVRTIPRLMVGDLLMVDASEDTSAIGKAVEIIGLEGREAVAGLHTILLRPD